MRLREHELVHVIILEQMLKKTNKKYLNNGDFIVFDAYNKIIIIDRHVPGKLMYHIEYVLISLLSFRTAYIEVERAPVVFRS